MDSSSTQCQFAYEGEDHHDDEDLRGWECPQEVAEASIDRCLFHLTEDELENVSHERIADAFLKCANSTGRRSKEFVAARIPLLDLTFQQIDAPDNFPIDLRSAEIGEIRASFARVKQPLLLVHSIIGATNFENVTFESTLDISSSLIGSLVCHGTRFREAIHVVESEVKKADFDNATFEKEARFRQTTFETGARFCWATFAGPANFESTAFESQHTNSDNLDSEEEIWREHHLSIGPLMYGRRAVDPKSWSDDRFFDPPSTEEKLLYYSERNHVQENFTHFNDFVYNGGDFRGVRFHDRAIFDDTGFDYGDFGKAQFHDRTSFVGTEIYGAVFFHAAHFNSLRMRFRPIDTGRIFNYENQNREVDLRNTARVYLTDTTVASGRLRQPSQGEVYYDISDATIGNVDIVSEKNAFDHLIVSRTDFDGFDFTEYREDLAAKRWKIDTASVSGLGDGVGRDETKREVTYLKAKRGAAQSGDSKSESEFFQLEMAFRSSNYGIDPHTYDSDIWLTIDMIKSLARITTNQLYRVTCGYGEKPYRVIASYAAVLLGLSAFLMLPYLAYGETDLFLLGIQQTSLVLMFGTPEASSGWVAGLIGVFQTFIIPTFVALLVFTLSRSIDR